MHACIQLDAVRINQTFPTLIVHPVEIDSKVFFLFFSFFALSAPGLAVRTGRENVIHIVAAVAIIICAAAVEGIEESTAAAWLARARQSANS